MLTWGDLDELKGIHYNKARAVYLGQFEGRDRAIDGENPEWLLSDPASTLIDLHRRYLAHVASRKILLRKRKIPRGDLPTYKSISYVVRGTTEYTRRSVGRIQSVMDLWDSYHLPYGMMIRISPRSKGSIWERIKEMKALMPKFLNWLRNHQVTIDGRVIRPYRGLYLWGWEPFESGFPHCHIYLARKCLARRLQKDILVWWKSYGIDIEKGGVKVQHARCKDSARAYALKYVTKGFSDPLWGPIFWLSGKRTWGVSLPLAHSPQANGQINSQMIFSCCWDRKVTEWELFGIYPSILADHIVTDRPPPEDAKEMARIFSPNPFRAIDGLGSRAKRYNRPT